MEVDKEASTDKDHETQDTEKDGGKPDDKDTEKEEEFAAEDLLPEIEGL